MRATKSDATKHKMTPTQFSTQKHGYSTARSKMQLTSLGLSSNSDSDSNESTNSTEFVCPKPAPIFDITKFNREMKHVQLKKEDYASICSFYDDIQTALIASTNNPNIIPDIEFLTPGFRFNKFIIPPKPSIAQNQAITTYASMSKALKKKLMHSNIYSTRRLYKNHQ